MAMAWPSAPAQGPPDQKEAMAEQRHQRVKRRLTYRYTAAQNDLHLLLHISRKPDADAAEEREALDFRGINKSCCARKCIEPVS